MCDRGTGECACRAGFEGAACERMSCSQSAAGGACLGRGRCMSLRRLAAHSVDYSYRTSDPATYGSQPQSPATWDADSIYGCAADLYGYYDSYHNITSYRGSQLLDRDCPVAFNSRLLDKVFRNGSGLLASNSSQLREVQRLSCGAGSGTFQLQFRGYRSARLSHNATAAQLQSALSALPSMGSVQVTYYSAGSEANASSNSSMALCSATDHRHAQVAFLSELGQVPLLAVTGSTLYGNTLSVSRMQAGSEVRAGSYMHTYILAEMVPCRWVRSACLSARGWGSATGRPGSASAGTSAAPRTDWAPRAPTGTAGSTSCSSGRPPILSVCLSV